MFEFELGILEIIQGFRNGILNNIFELITMFGEETPMVLIIAILYFGFNKNFAHKLFFITISSLSFNSIIKNLVKLPRPFVAGKITCVRPETATGYSFPSGHTQNFATWSTVLSIKFKKIYIFIITAFLIFLVGFSRVYLGAHFISDVLVGALLGILIAVIGSYIYDKCENKRKLYSMVILILTPFAIFFMISANPLFEDFYKFYGMIIGLLLAIIFEEKYAPIDYNVAWWKKVIRIIVGIFLAYIIKEKTEVFNNIFTIQISFIIEIIRYILLVFVVFGIWPLIFKKCKL